MKTEGKWDLGNIALFGAILMSEGVVGNKKEKLKDLMLQALNGKRGKRPLLTNKKK